MQHVGRTTPGGCGRWAAVASMLVGLALPATAAAGDRAVARTEAMAKLLAKAKRLSVTADCTYDVVQASGEKIEFGERREMVLRRPDRARIDATRRDGSRRGLLFDGAQLAVFDLDAKVYATVPKPGTTDAALAYFTEDLNMRLPLRELFSTDLPDDLEDVIEGARLVGEETLRGVATDHVALRGDTADLQLWIARTGEPLPQRIVITYRLAEGQPQFEANFSDWNFEPDASDQAFTFTPAAGAEQIPILAPRRSDSQPQP